MRALRSIQVRLQGRIQAMTIGHAPAMMISAILGAYLSLQIVSPIFG